VVKDGESVQEIAAAYSTTVTDVMNANALGNPTVHPGDILAIPLPGKTTFANFKFMLMFPASKYLHVTEFLFWIISACPSFFPKSASDHGLLLANGTYTVTAGNCVQCSCGPGNLK
jgi:LysM repeat protein